MARGPVAITHLGGYAAAILVAAICFGAVWAVAVAGQGAIGLNPSDWAALRFTVLQAALSSIMSVTLAIPLARALSRRRFPGQGIFVLIMGAPFILPVIVAVLGLVAVFGRNGWGNAILGLFGIEPISIYGLHGVVLAHVFFNLPLATRLILQGWAAIPAEHLRLAATLRFRSVDRFRQLEWPMLGQVVPGALALIFLICSTSFAVALVLGGGPKATTVELAIYQAFRFDFDLGHAAGLAQLQLAIGLLAAIVAFVLRAPLHRATGMDRGEVLPDQGSVLQRIIDACFIAIAGLFLFLPLVAIALEGFGGLADLTPSILPAILRSIAVAATAVVLTLGLALPLAQAAAERARGLGILAETLSFVLLSVSPLAIGTGLFLLIMPVSDPIALALPVTALVNAALALPFSVQALLPHMRQTEASYGRLAAHLGMAGRDKWRWLTLPRTRAPLGFAAGLTAALSIGDLGVIALFADPSRPTLPLYVYQLMGAYRSDAAAGAALILMIMSLIVFWLLDRGRRRDANS